MYQPLLPTIKPLVFEGKSGILYVNHKYNDTARLFLKEGIIEQVETNTLSGGQAAAACARWVSIKTTFAEGEEGIYDADQGIDTNTFLAYLEKAANNIKVIKKYIPDDQAIVAIDSEQLHAAGQLNTDDLKTAILFDGQKTIEEIFQQVQQPEIVFLTHICRLIIAGAATLVPAKNVIPEEERTRFLQELEDKLTDLIGPAGPILIEDGFKAIGSEPARLSREEIPALLSEVGKLLDPRERDELAGFGREYRQQT